MRPLHDPHGRVRLADIEPDAPLFLTERKTAYSPKSFYWHWYRHYQPLQNKCPVPFSPHDLRHLFVTEYLIRLKKTCGAGTDRFDAEKYLREREAFGLMIMGWRSARTIDIYDQSREGESAFSVLAGYQQDLSQRCEAFSLPVVTPPPATSEALPALEQRARHQSQEVETVWMHDQETLDWIKSMEQQTRHQS